MDTTFTIPEGFELKQTGDNQFAIVKKEENTFQDDCNNLGDMSELQRSQMESAIRARSEYIDPEYNMYHEMYQSGAIPTLNRHEMALLEFCHRTDMRKFLEEEVGKKPIDFSSIDGSFDGTSYFGRY